VRRVKDIEEISTMVKIHKLKNISIRDSLLIRYFRKAVGNIGFWIIVFFLIRLIGILNPPLETEHNWRQTFTCMIARNFFESNPNIMYPQVDTSGNRPGYVGSEFPLFNYIIFIISLIFGYQHWYGRLINLIISSAGVYFFSLLTEKITDRKTALAAGIILLSSIWFSFSRKIMPDTFSISLMIIGLYFCYSFITKGAKLHLWLFILFASLGILAKIPAISYLILLIIPLSSKKQSPYIKEGLMLGILIILIVNSAWYLYWVPRLIKTYGNQLYWARTIRDGFMELIRNWPGTLEKFYFSSFRSFIAFACFLTGIFFIIKDKKKYLITGFLLFSAVFGVFMIKSGSVFSTHSYYIIPFTPVMAVIGGYAVSHIPSRFYFIPLVVVALEGILNQQHDFFIKKTELYKLELEQIADSIGNKDDLFIVNDKGSPQILYFTHRKGWSVNNETMTDEKSINSFIKKGADYILIDKKSFENKVLKYPVAFQNDNITIYKLAVDR
jgi:4-amino-4-deoxy-L-arabinose transferase-like glycosyltransferase